LVLQAAT
jgi:hypothetical protein